MIHYTCPKCSAAMASPEEMAGQTQTCSQCGNVTTVPQETTQPPRQVAAVRAEPRPTYVFKMDVGRFPNSDEGLDALIRGPQTARGWRGPYIDDPNVLIDPWNRPWVYSFPGREDADRFDLFSAGPDRMRGTRDDIGKWSDTDPAATQPVQRGAGGRHTRSRRER